MNCRFASILETEEYQIGISAKGNPVKSKALKNRLKEILQKKDIIKKNFLTISFSFIANKITVKA